MLSKDDIIRVRGVDIPVTINCSLSIFKRVIILNFFCVVDGVSINKQYRTVTNDQNFYRDFKQYVDEKLTILDVVKTRLENKGFSEVAQNAP